MAFIIPNATDTTSSNKYAVLDQAEPDAIDFEILGNDKSGVVTGCEVLVAPSGGNTAVSVSSGSVALNGTIYAVPGNPFLNVPSNPSSGTARFDLVVARLSNSAMTLVVLYGLQSNTNPTYPKSSSRLTSTTGVPPLTYFNPDTDVVLASIYRATSLATILPGHIVDKRRSIQTPITYRGTTAPTASDGQVGDLYLRTSSTNTGESGLYVKRTSDTWAQLASSPIDPGIPIGSVITWIAPTAPNTGVWVECDGATVNRTGAYGNLFSVLGTTYGSGDGSTTFQLPDFRGMFLAGLPGAGADLGTQYGNTNNEVVLTGDQVPGHTHDINHGHTATTAANGTHAHGSDGGSHVHAMDHTHPSTTVSGGSHSHSANYLQNANNTGPNHYIRPLNFPSDGLIGVIAQGGEHSHTVNVPRYVGFTSPSSSGTSSSTSTGSHTHNVTINTSSGLVSSPNRITAPTAVNVQPRTMYVKYFIRYA
jgi:microcystin-dependent protein